ncbi:hypothetical protein BU14_1029s0002 [Porphyra umbilicalis]|uniref:Uncharacterized protein n=1 Tax=Porphyra umbilicalis TaxID=2786 RepID=A0A1X6NN38_PORUM|nr:hypothetical protein BU14_1029s0002 [Porphyra umbilicalis]|eukprot:OSX69896.1 hypothetical protein BU14_1029s0002 [Porphyra umbilicalis]
MKSLARTQASFLHCLPASPRQTTAPTAAGGPRPPPALGADGGRPGADLPTWTTCHAPPTPPPPSVLPEHLGLGNHVPRHEGAHHRAALPPTTYPTTAKAPSSKLSPAGVTDGSLLTKNTPPLPPFGSPGGRASATAPYALKLSTGLSV